MDGMQERTEGCAVGGEEEAGPFELRYDLSVPGEDNRAARAVGNWGRLHIRKSFDPQTRVLTLRFVPHPDDRWRPWEKVRKSMILEDYR